MYFLNKVSLKSNIKSGINFIFKIALIKEKMIFEININDKKISKILSFPQNFCHQINYFQDQKEKFLPCYFEVMS